MCTWLCLVYAGARVGGRQELEHYQLEQRRGLCAGWEDSAWGREEAVRRGEEKRKIHFLLPPDKRVNHAVMGIASPFSRQWRVLLADWKEVVCVGIKHEAVEDWFVVRDKEVIKKMDIGDIGQSVDLDLDRVKIRLSGQQGRLGENTVKVIL